MLHKMQVAIHFHPKKPSAQTTRNSVLVCMWCRQTVGRLVYSQVIAKFSWMGSVPDFVTHGAALCTLRMQELRYKAL